MALKRCHECGKEISDKAKTCPGCGAKNKRPAGPVGVALVLFFGAIVIYSVITGNQEADQAAQEKAAAEAAKTPEQRATEIAHKEKRSQQIQAAAQAAILLKRSMKDPTAFELTSLVLHKNGAACYEYRAKNSFGAILPSKAVLTLKGKLFTKEQQEDAFVTAWNRECTVTDGEDITAYLKRERIL